MSQEEHKFYQEPVEQVEEVQNTDISQGLSQSEADERLKRYGENEIVEEERTSTLQKFLNQFKDFMIIVLLIAAVISVVVSGDIADGIVILIVVLLNAVLGVIQENRAEDAIDALKDMSSPEARVRRDGKNMTVKGTEIVPGDVVILEAGDVVPADMRLTKESSLQVEEAALTGESVPVEKELGVIEDEVGIGDRLNMAFSSTNVTYGNAEGIVVATGMETEVGHIAGLLSSAEEQQTPLQEDQNQLGRWLTYAIIAIAIITFFIGTTFRGFGWDQMLLVSVSLAVAAIPEGLPAITTIILSIGTQNMANRNALIRSLPAVETLGSTQVIASDKTGTLTQNKMTIEKVFYNGEIMDDQEEISTDSPLLFSTAFANDAEKDSDGSYSGDPTEAAMLQFAENQNFNLEEELNKYPRIEEVPFDSDRKMMSTIHDLGDGRYLVAAKGAPDQLIKRSAQYYQNGETHELTADAEARILEANETLARQALRVLGGAYKIIDEIPSEVTSETVENDLIFAGLVGMIDPERPEAQESINLAKNAGIRTVMITGDHAVTAQAIATRLEILDPNASYEENQEHVMTGAQLNDISDEELEANVADYSVYARVSPEHKVRIIRAWQANNAVVAMTGDGVNDAPSLKQADIGVGMGITGTEVSKGASDMVLADDNYATIVNAVEEGRKVFANIQKSVQYLLSANLGEVLTLFIATLLGWQILEPIHILWINLVTDVFPAIALGMEPAEEDSMKYAPRDKDSHLLSNGVLPSIIYQGIFEGALTLGMFWFIHEYLGRPLNEAETMAFATLGVLQLFHAYNVKHTFKSLFSSNPFNNKYLNIAVLVSGLLLVGVIVTPGINQFFDVTPPTLQEWGLVFLTGVILVILVEIVKAILRATGFADRYNKQTDLQKNKY